MSQTTLVAASKRLPVHVTLADKSQVQIGELAFFTSEHPDAPYLNQEALFNTLVTILEKGEWSAPKVRFPSALALSLRACCAVQDQAAGAERDANREKLLMSAFVQEMGLDWMATTQCKWEGRTMPKAEDVPAALKDHPAVKGQYEDFNAKTPYRLKLTRAVDDANVISLLAEYNAMDAVPPAEGAMLSPEDAYHLEQKLRLIKAPVDVYPQSTQSDGGAAWDAYPTPALTWRVAVQHASRERVGPEFETLLARAIGDLVVPEAFWVAMAQGTPFPVAKTDSFGQALRLARSLEKAGALTQILLGCRGGRGCCGGCRLGGLLWSCGDLFCRSFRGQFPAFQLARHSPVIRPATYQGVDLPHSRIEGRKPRVCCLQELAHTIHDVHDRSLPLPRKYVLAP